LKKKLIAIAAMVFVTGTANAFEIEGTGTLSAQSKYVWRGVEQTTKPVAQGSLDFTTKFVEFGVWGSTLQQQKQYEVDPYVGVRYENSGVEGRLGLISYNYFGANIQNQPYTELYASVAYNNDYVTPSVTYYRSIQSKDVWIEGAVDVSYDIVSLKVGTSYGLYKSIKAPNGFETVFGSLTADLTNGFSANVDYSFALGDKKIAGIQSKNLISGGISYNF